MKKRFLLFIPFLAMVFNASAQDSIIKDVFEKFVEDKISSMQKVIDITDEQAEQLKEVELKFLLGVNSAENWWCNTKKKVKKLKSKKEEQLKEILRLDQYIKYDALENKKIKKHPIYME
ncbi:MAG TPA: hypothetical protein VLZ33_06000 [Dysgonamonadaceae bacterium]|nr:hypothetical protein [Dysgonamonadaceae bacterium]